MQLKLWNDGKLIRTTNKQVRDRILRVAQEEIWDYATIRVVYCHSPMIDNTGIAYNMDDLKRALRAFTEQQLIKSLQNN